PLMRVIVFLMFLHVQRSHAWTTPAPPCSLIDEGKPTGPCWRTHRSCLGWRGRRRPVSHHHVRQPRHSHTMSRLNCYRTPALNLAVLSAWRSPKLQDYGATQYESVLGSSLSIIIRPPHDGPVRMRVALPHIA